LGTGQGGTATLNIEQLIVRDGGTIRAASFNEGPAGDLNITSRSLDVQDGAEVTVSGEGSGPAGNLNITANSIRLDQGRLTAETQAGSGANINLQDVDLLLMRDQSLISAQAFNDANGGEVTIGAENGFIVAVPGEDTDIIANASEGRGGDIQITTQSIFGIEERRAIPGNRTNDIDASSQFGVNGEVAINTPDFDPSQGLVNLPNEPVNVEVAQGCQGGGTQASVEFFNTGRGGLAPNPYEPISSSELWEDVQLPKQRAENPAGASRASTSPATPPNEIVEAQGWLMNEKGQVVLLAQMPATHSQPRCRLR
jgi:large exoprotein involved in heme utilization and adhesion